jgi:hypothetical protein
MFQSTIDGRRSLRQSCEIDKDILVESIPTVMRI